MRYISSFVLLVALTGPCMPQTKVPPIPTAPPSQPFTIDEINAVVNVQMAQKAFLEAQEAYQKASAIPAAQSAFAKIETMNSPPATSAKNDKTAK